MEMEHLLDNKHSIGSMEDIMEISHITKKESMMNTLERFHIFIETRLDNQIIDNYTVKYNAIFDTIIHKKNTEGIHHRNSLLSHKLLRWTHTRRIRTITMQRKTVSRILRLHRSVFTFIIIVKT